MEKFYITTSIPYASGIPHIGNTYEAVLTDAIARYKKLRGFDVYMCTGTDEHGQKVQKLAEEQGISPKEHADKISSELREIWDLMDVEYDYFIRTTDAQHEATVSKIFEKLYKKGDIYKKNYEGWYCTPCESFITNSQIIEKDGEMLCPDCGAKLEKSSEEAYYFRLSNYSERLEKFYDANPNFIVPESRRNEMLNNFIRPGLQDFCVTRSTFDWGVKVPFDPKHVVYVWIDALSNYITALGYDPDGNNSKNFDKYWPADLHVIGKDIVRFHTIYWPCLLMALDVELPKQVLGHPWFLFGTDKMSKSKGNVLYARELTDLFGVDAVRFYLLSEMAFSADCSITYELLIQNINTNLANILGNLVNRTITMVQKYFDSIIPKQNELNEIDKDLIEITETAVAKYALKMDEYHISEAVDEILVILRRSNKYIDETMPWTLAKNDENYPRLATVIYNLTEAIRIAAVLLKPIIPKTCDKIFAQLGGGANTWESVVHFGGATVSSQKIGTAEQLFARIDEKTKFEEISNYHANTNKIEYENIADEITIEDFAKIDLRVAEVLECEPVKKSDKLLKLKLNLGFEIRQVVSGIAKWYKPEEIVGRKVVIVANLKPVKLRGELSQGMILAANNAQEKDTPETVIVLSANNSMAPGSKLH